MAPLRPITKSTVAKANQRAAQLQATTPLATAARYDRKSDRVILSLNTNLEIMFSPKNAQGLEHATPAQLTTIEISPSGYGIHFPKLDADLYLPALLEGFLGSRKWMAARLGAEGGKTRTRAKAAAARSNGALGGRPRKAATS
ncbi:DUF2442 domain-containing protein [Granulicella sp. dw_53]|uniref:DUF2442 domain-containing protein n=1 Tax=Granulicella sp. dw_53 TaxID=2719792 RepID=UPI001BD2E666|nr:DUF2442 domain-containing protein [Granulicella sp. dw_53]